MRGPAVCDEKVVSVNAGAKRGFRCRSLYEKLRIGSALTGLRVLRPMGVEKGTKAVIPANFSVYGKRTFSNLRTNLAVKIP